jgi:CheY-like chemotaxis protein
MRALVVDDQRDFFESVRPVLRKSGFEPEYAPNLDTARSNLEGASFDLVLTDLQMPPGNWGGLEVIKLVRSVDVVVPLFVVSGKGQLAESIEAMRLGADDYVRKEVFHAEFTARVSPRFETPYAIEHFPSLIAYLYRVFKEEPQGYSQARRLIDVYENTMRLLSLMLLSEELGRRMIPVTNLLNDANLARPSLGSYVSFVFDRLRSTWAGDLLTLLRAGDLMKRRSDCDRLTNCRNTEFGHSVVISKGRAIEIVTTFANVLVALLNAVSSLRQFRLIVAEKLSYDGSIFIAECKLLSGSNLHHRPIVMELHKPIPTGHVLAIRGASLIDLYPLVDVVTVEAGDRQFYKLYDKLNGHNMEFDVIPK